MTQAEFQSMMAARGCRVLGNGAFGVYKGYPYSAQITPAKRALVRLEFWRELGNGAFGVYKGYPTPPRSPPPSGPWYGWSSRWRARRTRPSSSG